MENAGETSQRAPQAARVRVHSPFGPRPAAVAREASNGARPARTSYTASAPRRAERAGVGGLAAGGVVEDAASRGRYERRVTLLDVASFATDWRTMIGAGLPVGEGLGLLERSFVKRAPALGRAIASVRTRVEQGKRLGEAFDPHRPVFGDLCVEMISAGEQTGRLESYLGEIADHYEQRHKNRATVLSALVEPALIIGVGVAVAYVILAFTVPRFSELYEALARNSTLPLPTRVLLGVAEFLTSPAGVAATIAVVASAAGAVFAVRRVDSVRARFERALLRIPLVGELVLKDAVARGCRTLGVVLKTVGDVTVGMEIAAKTCGNTRVAEGFAGASERVRMGRSIANSLAEDEVFPEMCLWMVRTGERTGTLDEMLVKLAEGFETQVRFMRERLLTLLRPTLAVGMGAFVLALMLAMYMPIFNLIEQIQRR